MNFYDALVAYDRQQDKELTGGTLVALKAESHIPREVGRWGLGPLTSEETRVVQACRGRRLLGTVQTAEAVELEGALCYYVRWQNVFNSVRPGRKWNELEDVFATTLWARHELLVLPPNLKLNDFADKALDLLLGTPYPLVVEDLEAAGLRLKDLSRPYRSPSNTVVR